MFVVTDASAGAAEKDHQDTKRANSKYKSHQKQKLESINTNRIIYQNKILTNYTITQTNNHSVFRIY
jgi:hypothetical protein